MFLNSYIELKVGSKIDEAYHHFYKKLIKQPIIIVRQASKEEFMNYWLEEAKINGFEAEVDFKLGPYFYVIITD